MRETNAGFIVGQGILDGIELRTLAERLGQSGLRVDVFQLSIGLRFFCEVELQRVQLGIAIGANGEAERLLGLGERIRGLDDLDLAGGNFRLGAIDIERRQGSELERTFVAVVTGLGQLERLLLHIESAARLHGVPVLTDNIQDGVVDLGVKVGARLLERASRDLDLGGIGEAAGAAQQGLGEGEIQRGTEVGIEVVIRTVGGKLVAGDGGGNIGAGSEGLRVTHLAGLTEGVKGWVA